MKKSAIQARLGMHGGKCFCLFPEVWVSSGAEPAASRHRAGCQLHLLHAWAEPPWEQASGAAGGNETLLIRVVFLLGIFCFESFQL